MKWFGSKATAQQAVEVFHSRALNAEEERDAARENLQTERERANSLEAELGAKKRECDAAHRMISEVQGERDAARQNNKTLREQCNNTSHRATEAERQLQGVQAEVDTARRNNETLRDQLQVVTAERDWKDRQLRFSADKLQEVMDIIKSTDDH